MNTEGVERGAKEISRVKMCNGLTKTADWLLLFVEESPNHLIFLYQAVNALNSSSEIQFKIR